MKGLPPLASGDWPAGCPGVALPEAKTEGAAARANYQAVSALTASDAPWA